MLRPGLSIAPNRRCSCSQHYYSNGHVTRFHGPVFEKEPQGFEKGKKLLAVGVQHMIADKSKLGLIQD